LWRGVGSGNRARIPNPRRKPRPSPTGTPSAKSGNYWRQSDIPTAFGGFIEPEPEPEVEACRDNSHIRSLVCGSARRRHGLHAGHGSGGAGPYTRGRVNDDRRRLRACLPAIKSIQRTARSPRAASSTRFSLATRGRRPSEVRLDRMPEAMGERRQTAEHPFGTLKAWMGNSWTLPIITPRAKAERSAVHTIQKRRPSAEGYRGTTSVGWRSIGLSARWPTRASALGLLTSDRDAFLLRPPMHILSGVDIA
jgi:hypothetical protein